jgi:predicted TIM-barrel fold metal-dependent hydrolase
MAKTGTTIAILSITAPGVEIMNGEASFRLARDINTYAAKLRDSKPKQFGFFAALPSLLDTEAAITEIRYALDVLKADGVTLFTSYGDHKYLGNAIFAPIWKELNARSAIVFIHPTHSFDTTLVNPKLPQPMIDYPHETTHTAVDIITSGVKRVNSNCKIVLSHAGGSLSYLTSRISYMYSDLFHTGSGPSSQTLAEIEEDAKSFYFDLALSGTANILDALLKWAPQDHVLFGTDFPCAPVPSVRRFTESLDAYEMNDELRRKICYENAWVLFPRLREA